LYQYYGYTTGDIGKLFIAGFGSSMIFGTIVGSLADRLYVFVLLRGKRELTNKADGKWHHWFIVSRTFFPASRNIHPIIGF
jgi:hypothetical protein